MHALGTVLEKLQASYYIGSNMNAIPMPHIQGVLDEMNKIYKPNYLGVYKRLPQFDNENVVFYCSDRREFIAAMNHLTWAGKSQFVRRNFVVDVDNKTEVSYFECQNSRKPKGKEESKSNAVNVSDENYVKVNSFLNLFSEMKARTENSLKGCGCTYRIVVAQSIVNRSIVATVKGIHKNHNPMYEGGSQLAMRPAVRSTVLALHKAGEKPFQIVRNVGHFAGTYFEGRDADMRLFEKIGRLSNIRPTFVGGFSQVSSPSATSRGAKFYIPTEPQSALELTNTRRQ